MARKETWQVEKLLTLTLFHPILSFNDADRGLENIVEQGENAGNQHFLLFPQSISIL